MDAVMEPGVEKVVLRKPTQVGFTELGQCLAGYWIDLDPGAALIVMPDELSCKEVIEERLLPTIHATPALRKHLTGKPRDEQKLTLKLDTMPIFTAWAGSPMRLAMKAIRFLLMDEIDKYPAFSGREVGPMQLAEKRTSNWGHRTRTIVGGTPTTRNGNVMREWKGAGDKRRFELPCPHCSTYQSLKWRQITWPKLDIEDKIERADTIKQQSLAYYKCETCENSINDHHLPRMLEQGAWVSQSQWVDQDGTIHGDRPLSGTVAFYINAIYSPWISVSKLASEFIKAEGSRELMMDFRNSRLAEPMEDQMTTLKMTVFERKYERAVERRWEEAVVPTWAGVLTTTVDTQKDHFHLSIRAWGKGYRSRLIYYRKLDTFDEVQQLGLSTGYPIEDSDGLTMRPKLLLIDSGGTKDDGSDRSRTQQVYQFASRNPAQIIPIKGASHTQATPIRVTRIKAQTEFEDEDEAFNIGLRVLDTGYFKDMLASCIYAQEDHEGEWQLSDTIGRDYLFGLPVEHKVYDRDKGMYRWEPIDSAAGRRNHPWDLETYQMAAAELAHVNDLPKESVLIEQRKQTLRNRDRQKSTPRDHVQEEAESGSDWLNSFRGKY